MIFELEGMSVSSPVPSSADGANALHGVVADNQPDLTAVSGPVAEAEVVAARISTDDAPMGRLGRRFNWKAPFFVGLATTAGVAVTYGFVQLFLTAAHTVILLGLAFFLAVGLEPAVQWLSRHRVKRGVGVAVVLLGILAIIGGFLAAAIPAVASQITQLVTNAPRYLAQAQDHSSFLGKLNDKYDLVAKVQSFISTSGTTIADGLIGAGTAIFNGLADTLIVFVLTIYFLADFPRIRAFIYRFLPGSRRPRAILIGDDILTKVGGYVLGNLIISVIAGALTFIWLLSFGVPYPLLLAILVALLDLVPVIGSTIAGIVVALVALTVSLPVALLTVGFFVLYRLAEDYYLVPRIIGRAVEVPALVTVVAVLVGGALLGILGALVAIPLAAGVLLILREVLFPRLDQL